MTIRLTIDGDDYPMSLRSFAARLQTGLAGVELSAEVTSIGAAPPNPTANSKVELSIGGLTFDCRLATVGETGEGRTIKYALSARGHQERLRRSVAYDVRVTTAVSTILPSLLTGTGIAASVPNDKDCTGGFRFSGSVADAVMALAARTRMVPYIHPSGTLFLYDFDNLPPAPFNLQVDTVPRFNNLSKQRDSDLPVTRVILHGGVKKLDPADDDSESRTISVKGDGTNPWFDYPDIADEVTLVKVDGTDQTITYQGSGAEASADVVNFRTEYRLFFNTPPPDGDKVEITFTIQRATAVENDTTTQDDLNTKWPDWDGVVEYEAQDASIRTQEEADQAAVSLLATLNTAKKSASATVTSLSVFHPGMKPNVADPRSSWDFDMPVTSNSLKWDSAQGQFQQAISLDTGLVTGGGGGLAGVGQRIGQRTKTQTKPPPTEASPMVMAFRLLVTPTSDTVDGGSSTTIDYTATLEALTGWTADVILKEVLRNGVTGTWDNATVAGGSGTATLSITPTDGMWTDADADEEGDFFVYGTTASSVAAVKRANFTGQPAEDDTITLNGTTATYKTTPGGGNEIARGASQTEARNNAVTFFSAIQRTVRLASVASDGSDILFTALVPGLDFGLSASSSLITIVTTTANVVGNARRQTTAFEIEVTDNGAIEGAVLDFGTLEPTITDTPGAGDITRGASASDTASAIAAFCQANAGSGFNGSAVGAVVTLKSRTGMTGGVSLTGSGATVTQTAGTTSEVDIGPCDLCDVYFEYSAPPNICTEFLGCDPEGPATTDIDWFLRYAGDCAGHEDELIDSGTITLHNCALVQGGAVCSAGEAMDCWRYEDGTGLSPDQLEVAFTDFCGVDRVATDTVNGCAFN